MFRLVRQLSPVAMFPKLLKLLLPELTKDPGQTRQIIPLPKLPTAYIL